jgi:hypothetical protein
MTQPLAVAERTEPTVQAQNKAAGPVSDLLVEGTKSRSAGAVAQNTYGEVQKTAVVLSEAPQAVLESVETIDGKKPSCCC